MFEYAFGGLLFGVVTFFVGHFLSAIHRPSWLMGVWLKIIAKMGSGE